MPKSLSQPPLPVRPTPQDYPQPGESWQGELKRSVRTPRELLERVGLGTTLLAGQSELDFPILVPPPYLSRIEAGNPSDPLLLQVLATPEEAVSTPGYYHDPVGDLSAQASPGLIRKYAGRALLIASGTCAVNCRYCFRRHFPYSTAPKGIKAWGLALEHIGNDSSIQEVILSGGDPLMLVDDALGDLLGAIDDIRHIRRIRIHTRLPVVIPSRVTSHLASRLNSLNSSATVVLHINHANEIDHEVADAAGWLRDSNCLLYNQSVLLRGVNDDTDALAALSEKLIDIGVTPYYLHRLDPVQGAAHFSVAEEEGIRLIKDLRSRLPGYMVPRFAAEIAGEPHKVILA